MRPSPREPAVQGPHDGRDRRERRAAPRSTSYCDIVIADRMMTGLYSPPGAPTTTWKLRVDVWRDERTILGGTDAGTHLDLLATFNATTSMLGRGRAQALAPALGRGDQLHRRRPRFYGIKDRGRLAEGYWADVCVIDPRRSVPVPPMTRPRSARRRLAPLRRGRRHRPRVGQRRRDRRSRRVHRGPSGVRCCDRAGTVGAGIAWPCHRKRSTAWSSSRTQQPTMAIECSVSFVVLLPGEDPSAAKSCLCLDSACARQRLAARLSPRA